MTKHPWMSTSPELPRRATSRVSFGFSIGGSLLRPRKMLHQIEFFSGSSPDRLLDEEPEPEELGEACWSLAAHEGRPRDPRLCAAIDAAGRDFISDRARLSG